MKKILLWLALVFLGIKLSAQTENASQYPVMESMIVYDVASFEEGVDSTWKPSAGKYAPRFWTTASPVYNNYTPGTTSIIHATNFDTSDNANYWDTYGDISGTAGYTGFTDLDYQLYIPSAEVLYSSESWTSNYQNWSGYSEIQIKWKGVNSDSTKHVLLQVFAFTRANGGQWLDLTSLVDRTSNTLSYDGFSLRGYTAEQLSQIAALKFRVFNHFITPGDSAMCGYQRTYIYSVKLLNDNVPVSKTTIGKQYITSHFLGTIFHKRYGSYSASGFYDQTAGKFRIWFGGGTPDGDSQDNVWYTETNSLNPDVHKGTDFKVTRCTITPTNVLVNKNGKNWCWGDPSVIKVASSSNPSEYTYYAYISGLQTSTSWNQVYRLVSINGIDWTINPTTPVVSAASGGIAGYGSGAPSVVQVKDSVWLWYYSQSETAGAGVYLRKSADGINFSDPIYTNVGSGLDAKYVDSLNAFVAVSDVETHGGGIYTLVSTDGISWSGGAPPYLSQDTSAYLCHNPGLIGTELGHGWKNMYATYGASQEAFGATEYYTRELEYSSLHFSENQDTTNYISFSTKTDFTTDSGPFAVAAADLNSDGKPDIIVANQKANDMSVLINTTTKGAEAPTFSAKTDFKTGNVPYSVGIIDVNGDGKPDVTVSNAADNTVSVFMNITGKGDAAPGFAAKTDLMLGVSPVCIAVADVNGDNKPDLVVANHNENTLSVLINMTSTGATTPSFTAKADFPVGGAPFSVVVADVNNDGKPDAIVSNHDDNTVSVLLNTTETNSTTVAFSTKSDFPIGNTPFSVSTSDVNGDGKPDIIAANFNDNTVSVLLNTTSAGASTPSFSLKTDFITGTTPYFVTSADLNNDSKPEIIVTDLVANAVSVLTSTIATGATVPTFLAKSDFNTASLPYSVAIADFNSDTKPDIITADFSADVVSVLLNTTDFGSITKVNNQIPISFNLYQNYPNPFNPATTIKYNVAKSGLVTLKVYNILGQEVATLINREQNPGEYSISFNASKLGSGMYIYRIISGNSTMTKKMMLLK